MQDHWGTYMNNCRICGNQKGNKIHTAREMMFGYRDRFDYIECAQCGCVQIREIPGNLSIYYPKDYYAHHAQGNSKECFLRRMIHRQRASYCFSGKNPIGFLWARVVGIPDHFAWLKKGKVRFDSKILDVGCGAGNLLLKMKREGFKNLSGIDLYIEKDLDYGASLTIQKKEIAELEGFYDFIMMHHSFEHMAEPLEVMKHIYRLLKPDRYALIRIPIALSYAWKKYGVNWVQLDPPRHLFLHTIKSMNLLVEKVNLSIEDIVYDSSGLQFNGSEQYIKDIPLFDDRSYYMNPGNSMFSKQQIQEFKDKAAELNKKQEGDQACFYLYKKPFPAPGTRRLHRDLSEDE